MPIHYIIEIYENSEPKGLRLEQLERKLSRDIDKSKTATLEKLDVPIAGGRFLRVKVLNNLDEYNSLLKKIRKIYFGKIRTYDLSSLLFQ